MSDQNRLGRVSPAFLGTQPLLRELEAARQQLALLEQERDRLRDELDGSLEDRERLRLTVEQQREHLDALASRVEAHASREAELRAELLDAHAQLVARDELFVSLGSQEQALVALLLRSRPWRHRLKARLGLIPK